MIPKELIIYAAAREFAFKPEYILGNARNIYVNRARFALYKAFRLRGASYPQIGSWTNRHHTTVMHGVLRAGEIMASEPVYAQRVMRIAGVVEDKGDKA
jgi:chromosomal replication initiation ATPase DnaA